jgi:hypothetical protein
MMPFHWIVLDHLDHFVIQGKRSDPSSQITIMRPASSMIGCLDYPSSMTLSILGLIRSQWHLGIGQLGQPKEGSTVSI